MIRPEQVGIVISAIQMRMQESRQQRDPHIERADRNNRVREFGQPKEPTSREVVSNHIIDDIDAITDQQTKNPPIITYECTDDGTPSLFFLKDQETAPMNAQQVQAMLSESAGPAGELLPPLETADNVVEVSSRTVSKYYQKQCDWYWKRGVIDEKVRKVTLQANTLGFQFPVYEFRNGQCLPRLWHDISLKQCFPDPHADMMEDAEYFIIEWIRDAREAEAMFGQFADAIEEVGAGGQPQRIDGASETTNDYNTGAITGIDFKRPMITLRVAWLRNQPCPMTEEEALSAGLVEHRDAPAPLPAVDYADDGDPQPAIDSGEGQGTDLLGGDDAEPGIPGQATPEGDSEEADPATNGVGGSAGSDDGDTAGPDSADGDADLPGGDAGAQAQPPAPGQDEAGAQPPPARQLFHVAGDQPITAPTQVVTPKGTYTETHADWPMKLVVRQLIIIQGQPTLTPHDRIVQDIECPYWDIPVSHTVGIARLFTMFGMGMPQKLESMQRGRNRAITAVVEHSDYHRFPVWVMPKSVQESLPETFKKYRQSMAGLTIYVRDDLYTRLGGKILSTVAPEPVSSSLIDVINLLETELDQRSNHAQVTEGTPPDGVTGHQSIELLQDAANAKFGYAQQSHLHMTQRIAELHRHAVVHNVPINKLMELDKSYPAWAVAAMQQWAQNANWDVDVQDSSGVNRNKRQIQTDAFNKFNVRDPQTGQPVIAMETLQERTDEDPDRERERWEKDRNAAQQQQMQQQMQQAQLTAATAPPPAQPGKPNAPAGKPAPPQNGRMAGATK